MLREGTVSAGSGPQVLKGDPAAAPRWGSLSQSAPSTPGDADLSREAFGQVIWQGFSLPQLVRGERR